MPKAICEDCGSLVEAELTHNGVCPVGHYVHCGWGHQLSPDDLISDAAAIEILTEQLEAARADAKEAEAYAEELEKEIELNEQEACMLENDLIKADKEIDNLKVKLAKAVEGLNYCINAPFSGWTIAQGYARATLAEIESSEAVTLEGEKGCETNSPAPV
jgi:hypothetical protein